MIARVIYDMKIVRKKMRGLVPTIRVMMIVWSSMFLIALVKANDIESHSSSVPLSSDHDGYPTFCSYDDQCN